MIIRFFCPRWGFEHVPWDTFLKGVKDEGFSGIEWYPFSEAGDTGDVVRLLARYGLDLSIVMTVRDAPADFPGYLQALERQLLTHARTGQPLFISAQTGREYYTRPQIDGILEVCGRVSETTGVPVYQETHRNKWSYAAHVVGPVLEAHPQLPLTLDISHWFCVSESFLEDQQETVRRAIRHTRHIHTRVGHTQGPQVWDPALDEYTDALRAHLDVWDACVRHRRSLGDEVMTMTPEFGPPPYLVKGKRSLPDDQEQFRLNLWMKRVLEKRYASF